MGSTRTVGAVTYIHLKDDVDEIPIKNSAEPWRDGKDPASLVGLHTVITHYERESYEGIGAALLLFRRGPDEWAVLHDMGHCSCYDCWDRLEFAPSGRPKARSWNDKHESAVLAEAARLGLNVAWKE